MHGADSRPSFEARASFDVCSGHAIADFEAALRLDPQDVDARGDLAQTRALAARPPP
jgi:hypothetical protein